MTWTHVAAVACAALLMGCLDDKESGSIGVGDTRETPDLIGVEDSGSDVEADTSAPGDAILPGDTGGDDTADTSVPDTTVADTADTSVPDTIVADTADTSVPEDTIVADTADTSVPEDTIVADTADTSVPQDTIVADTADTSVPEDTIVADTADTSVPQDTIVADTADTSVPQDTIVADTADTAVPDTVVAGVCGDEVLDPGEACDDGNTCALDGCHPDTCEREPTVVLTRLALDPDLGFDLDDADGDGNLYTGRDNLLASNAAITQQINNLLESALDDGSIIQLITLGDVQDLGDDPDISVSFHLGVDPACPPSDAPVPWRQETIANPILYSDAGSFDDACRPDALITDDDHPDNGIYAAASTASQPTPPILFLSADALPLPGGPLGVLRVARAHLEATIARTTAGALRKLVDGRLGGVIPAAALYRIDTSALLPLCPTALHAVLGLIGHIDQDAEGNGGKDWIKFTTGLVLPCILSAVTIVGCCDDGDCGDGGYIPGASCPLDPRIGDGYSAGFSFEARAVDVDASVDGAGYCP